MIMLSSELKKKRPMDLSPFSQIFYTDLVLLFIYQITGKVVYLFCERISDFKEKLIIYVIQN